VRSAGTLWGQRVRDGSQEVMGSGSLFSFVSPGVSTKKGRLTWNGMGMCGGSWSLRG